MLKTTQLGGFLFRGYNLFMEPSFENSSPKPNPFYKYLRQDMQQEINRAPEGSGLTEKKIYILSILRTSDQLKKFPEDLEKVLQEIETSDPKDENDLVDIVTTSVCDLFHRNFTLQELEKRSRELRSIENGEVEVNRVLNYDIHGQKLHIHIPLTLIENPMELRKLFMEGLKKLSTEIKENPELKDITTIHGKSWIIYKHPKLLEAAGFTIISRDETAGQGVAEMSREDFIKRYE